MNESDAKAALRAQGIRNPSRQLVEDYMRLQQAEEWALEVPQPSLASESAEGAQEPSSPGSAGSENPTPPRPTSSKSNLKPFLAERGELVRERPRCVGRPKVIAPWYQAVAIVMSDGTPLRQALASLGIQVSQRELRALYRNTKLTRMRREAREKWQREWGFRKPSSTRRPKGCEGADCLGASLRKMLRTL